MVDRIPANSDQTRGKSSGPKVSKYSFLIEHQTIRGINFRNIAINLERNLSLKMKRLKSIDILRGLAIFGVVFHHLFFAKFRYGLTVERLSEPVTTFLSSGWLGVNLFFILSGFVLYLPYAQGRRQVTTGSDVLRFYKIRAQRLLPLYYLSAAVAVASVYHNVQVGTTFFWRSVANYAFVTYPFSSETFMPPGNWVLWSIGIEIWFSVLFPGLLWLTNRYGIVRVLIAAIVLALMVRYVGREYFASHSTRVVLNHVSDSVLGRVDEFVFGMAAASLYVAKYRPPKMQSALLCVVLIAVSMELWALWYRSELPYVSSVSFNLPLDSGLFLLILLAPRLQSPGHGLLWPMQAAGIMCYSIYVWHGIILIPFRELISQSWTFVPVYLCASLFVACITFKIVESRGRPWKEILPPILQIDASDDVISEKG
ncbi:acyltransferase [Caballeronia sp. LZ043]|uniref:acyltransferase family protein n=1 Tax=Caballeronia sp. LZ043 TaxID=3038569 RepID=UPI00285D9B1F|nr:acyltransferase [Caballeronia sp. LZ043]MDR5826160.1 acyltransferase [Caballeronia sp. LZ043]